MGIERPRNQTDRTEPRNDGRLVASAAQLSNVSTLGPQQPMDPERFPEPEEYERWDGMS